MNKYINCDRCDKRVKEKDSFPHYDENLCEKCFDPISEQLTDHDEELPEERYHTWDEANYNGFSQSDFI